MLPNVKGYKIICQQVNVNCYKRFNLKTVKLPIGCLKDCYDTRIYFSTVRVSKSKREYLTKFAKL